MTTPQLRIIVRSATDIIEIVPTLLGFIPTESLVAIYLQARSGCCQVAVTARGDLPLSPTESAATLRMLDGHAARFDAIILVAYSLDSTAADTALLDFIASSGFQKIQTAISATPEGWAEVELDAPILRHPYPVDGSQVAAEIVSAGLTRPLGGRENLRDSIAAPEEPDVREFAALVARSEPMTGEDLAARLQRWTAPDAYEAIPTISRDEAAVLVTSVQDIQNRDAAWAAISSADAERHADLWRQVARLTDGRPVLPVLGLLGMAAWIAGDGALANLVLDRAERTEGYASLFELLEEVLRLGVDPRIWDSLREAIVAQIAD